MTAQIVLNYSRKPVDIYDPILMDGDFASVRIDVVGQLWERVAEGKRRDG